MAQGLLCNWSLLFTDLGYRIKTRFYVSKLVRVTAVEAALTKTEVV